MPALAFATPSPASPAAAATIMKENARATMGYLKQGSVALMELSNPGENNSPMAGSERVVTSGREQG